MILCSVGDRLACVFLLFTLSLSIQAHSLPVSTQIVKSDLVPEGHRRLATTGTAQGSVATRPNKNDPEAIYVRAVQLHQAGDLEGAIREYQAFLAVRPERVDARSN